MFMLALSLTDNAWSLLIAFAGRAPVVNSPLREF